MQLYKEGKLLKSTLVHKIRDTTGALMSFQIDHNSSMKELQRAFELEVHSGCYHANKHNTSCKL